MRPRLMHPECDVALQGRSPPDGEALLEDLELGALFEAMALGDRAVAEVARHALLTPLTDPAAIAYRQAALRDCLALPGSVRDLHALAVAAIARANRASWAFMPRQSTSIVRHSRDVLQTYVRSFRDLRRIAEAEADRFASEAFRRFFAMVRRELPDDYLRELDRQLRALRFQGGIRVRARLGAANKGGGYGLQLTEARGRLPWPGIGRWWDRIRGHREPGLGFQLEPGDERGVRALEQVRDHCLERAADVLEQATEHVAGFFEALRAETAFYVGCLNLCERLSELGLATCMPEPVAPQAGASAAQGLYDPCLALRSGRAVVDNDLAADGAALVIVTGANQGGKTTFLRSVGVAQLMMQCGMFAPARSYRSSVGPGVFTHFRREEDRTMTRGKLDEELARMSAIADELGPGSLLLLNESFAATNEREGSEIARQIVEAVTGAGVRVLFVTHLDEFARRRYEHDRDGTVFLRAERLPDGSRTFKLREGAPERTSHGIDLYRAIFEGEGGGASELDDEDGGGGA